MDETRRPVEDLRNSLAECVPEWVERVVLDVVERQDLDVGRAQELLDDRSADVVSSVLAELEALLDTDVDEQRGNPLAVLRQHVSVQTAILVELGAAPVSRDPFDERVAPDDLFDLGPANWADVHPALAEPGLVWGAWKAATILQRRRDEGMR